MERIRNFLLAGIQPSGKPGNPSTSGAACEDPVEALQISLPRIQSDEPIDSDSEDLLGRKPLATAVAATILDLDTKRGSVVAITGPWGSGKTSLIGLIRRELERDQTALFVEFNPWLFSQSDDLLDRFFVEISAQLKDVGGQLNQIATAMAAYGDVLGPISHLPLIGTWSSAAKEAVDTFKKISEHRRGGVLAKRNHLIKLLEQETLPIVVAIDDIDRLSTDEVREVFKLVRLTGNFPNIVYLLAFDRRQVEAALESESLSGRDYLEKIVQVVVEIPDVPGAVLHIQIELALQGAIQLATGAPMRVTDRLVDVFHEILKPNFHHIRHVRRYGASISPTIRQLHGVVALEDALALEAIRLFHPDLFHWIRENRTLLTYLKSRNLFALPSVEAEHATSVQKLLEQDPDRAELIKSLIRLLFPLASHHVETVVYDESSLPEWLSAHRVAHPQYLALYLERIAGDELEAFWLAEEAAAQFGNPETFVDLMLSKSEHARVASIEALQSLAQNVEADQIIPAIVGVLNLADSLPKYGKLDLRPLSGDPRRELRGVVFRLLNRIPAGPDTETVVRAVLPRVHSLGARLMLLKLVGHHPNAGHGLVEPSVSAELEASLRADIRGRAPGALADERNILGTLMWEKTTRLASEPGFDIPTDMRLRCAILRDGLARAVINMTVPEYGLAWESLIEILGGEEAIRSLLAGCQPAEDDHDLVLAKDLAARYLTGWRPEHFNL